MSAKTAITYSAILIGIAYLINQIPLSDVLELYFEKQTAEFIENIIFFFLLCSFSLLVIKRLKIPVFYFDKSELIKLYYFIPVILFFLLFSGIFRNSDLLDSSFLAKETHFLYTLEELLGAAFEEILFRGFVFGILLSSLYHNEKGVLKAVIISGLLFGFTHIINLKTLEGNTLGNVLNQVYGTTNIGIMWACVYYKTRNLWILILIHFANNFFAGLESLFSVPADQLNNATESVQSTINMIFSGIIQLVVFGLPAVLGLLILAIPSRKDDLKWQLKLKEQ